MVQGLPEAHIAFHQWDDLFVAFTGFWAGEICNFGKHDLGWASASANSRKSLDLQNPSRGFALLSVGRALERDEYHPTMFVATHPTKYWRHCPGFPLYGWRAMMEDSRAQPQEKLEEARSGCTISQLGDWSSELLGPNSLQKSCRSKDSSQSGGRLDGQSPRVKISDFQSVVKCDNNTAAKEASYLVPHGPASDCT